MPVENILTEFMVVDSDNSTDLAGLTKGVVRWFNQSGKFGVIKDSQDQTDYFVYVTNTIDRLYDGIEVVFKKSVDPLKDNRLSAIDVSYDKESTVNEEILYKINKIDMCFSYISSVGSKKPNINELQFISNLKLKVNMYNLESNLNTLYETIEPKYKNTHVNIYKPLDKDLASLYELYSYVQGIMFLMVGPQEGDQNILEIWRYDKNRVLFLVKNKESITVHLKGVTKEVVFKHKFSFIKNSILMKDSNTIIGGSSVSNDWFVCN
tara:strand:+ start:3439 stop:4233 length:795 start_codon:yes stop_codon:yes gene_type:complete